MNDSGHIGGGAVIQPPVAASDFGGTVGSNAADLALLAHLRDTGLLNAFKVEGPALISFSGGRTSAFMLWLILQAHDGALPENVYVTFANTGMELEETLVFVQRCSTEWGVPIHWLEFRDLGSEVEHRITFEKVTFETASRDGEPFEALIDWKKFIPNGGRRICTEELKVRTMFRFMASLGLEAGSYAEVIGLRSDEPRRLERMAEGNVEHGRACRAPLATAKLTVKDVFAFWRVQPFDLGLQPWEGNCTLCFAKGKGIRKRIIRDRPSTPVWWNRQEVKVGAHFSGRDSIAGLVAEVEREPAFDFYVGSDPDDEHDVECGTWCVPDDRTAEERTNDIRLGVDALIDFAHSRGDFPA